MLYEIIEGDYWTNHLHRINLDPTEQEELREALDWLLSRNPEGAQRYDYNNAISMYFVYYRPRGLDLLMICYRIEGNTVVLEEAHVDVVG